MITPAQALQLVLTESEVLPPTYYQLNQAIGLCLETDIKADQPYPAFNKSLMDGYAVKLKNSGQTVFISGECTPGKEPVKLEENYAVAIFTGAPCPEGCEAVVKTEDCTVNTDGSVTLPIDIESGQNIELFASIVKKEQLLLEKGSILTPLKSAVASFCGLTRIKTIRRPVVAIIITGDEILKPGKSPSKWELRDSNAAIISGIMELMGVKDISIHFRRDNPREYEDLIDSIEADVVIFSGSAGIGKYDIVPRVLENAKVKRIFHKVSQKPGHPMYFGKLNKTLFFGLPGNPAGVKICTDRYICPAIQKMMGIPVHTDLKKTKLLKDFTVSNPLTSFIFGNLTYNNQQLEFLPTFSSGSADIFSTSNSDCYAVLESGEYTLKAGSEIPVYIPPYLSFSSIFSK